MPTPHDLLHNIHVELDTIFEQATALNAQQLTFVQHIRKTTEAQIKQFEPMPSTAYALQSIIPSLSDQLLQQQSALFGYAKLLLERPESFDNVTFPVKLRPNVERISLLGQQLYHLTERIQQSAITERKLQQQSPETTFNLVRVLDDELPVLRYFLHDKSVQLTSHCESIEIRTSRYHLIAFIQHIIITLADELIEYGHIKLSTQGTALHIFCTGIQLNQEEIDTLFVKQGRYVYPRRFEADGGKINFIREQGRGASIVLHLPTN